MDNPFSLKENTILVTGASSGIGQQIAISLSQMNANIMLTARNEERLSQSQNKLTKGKHKIFSGYELTQLDDIALLVSKLPVLDGVVLSAGIVQYIPAKFINPATAKEIFDVNYFGQLFLIQQMIKEKKLSKGASILFISSISSTLGVPATTLYAASKAAINSTVKVLASELASQRIRVNAICPGIVRTPLTENAKNTIDRELFEKAEKAYPLGYGTPEDIAYGAIYFMSPASKWVTGTLMIMDGGFTLQ